MLTKQQDHKAIKRKPFVLKLSVAQVKAMSNRYVVDGDFLGPAPSVVASAIPKILPVLGTLGLAAASGAVSGATKKAVSGNGI